DRTAALPAPSMPATERIAHLDGDRRLPHCGISIPAMTAPGHSRHSRYPGVSGSPQERTFGQGPRLLVRALRTARWWRGIVAFTHPSREGRMTVTIGRRELLAAFGGAAAGWPLAARAQQAERVRSQTRTAQMTTTSDVTGLSSSISVITSENGGSI